MFFAQQTRSNHVHCKLFFLTSLKKSRFWLILSKKRVRFIYSMVVCGMINRSSKFDHSSSTCKSDFIRPARASSSVVFPELGGPNRRVNLQINIHIIHYLLETTQTRLKIKFSTHLEGRIIPLRSSKIFNFLLLPPCILRFLNKAFIAKRAGWPELKKTKRRKRSDKNDMQGNTTCCWRHGKT